MNTQQQFEHFRRAFFRTAKEKQIDLSPTARCRVMLALAGMRHWWGSHNDEFNRIRAAELLAAKLAKAEQEKSA